MSSLCPVCGSGRSRAFEETVLGKYPVSYYLCEACGLLQTEEPYWLDEAYGEAIAITDTGIVQRNIRIARKLSSLLYVFAEKSCRGADVAGGYGLLVRLMRDYGFNFYWDDKYCKNVLARGFEADIAGGEFGVVTAFEVLEHLDNPLSFISESLERYRASIFVFSTLTYESDRVPERDWWYYSFATGQHICFYTKETLRTIAERLGLHFYSYGDLHVMSKSRLPRWLVCVALGPAANLLSVLARRRLGSKTFADHTYMMDKLKRE